MSADPILPTLLKIPRLAARARTFVCESVPFLGTMGAYQSRNDVKSSNGKHKAIIISGFCAIGKTYFSSTTGGKHGSDMVHDLDSSAYSSKPGFPENYVADIRKLAEKSCIILISTHRGLPTRLTQEGYYVALVYPRGGAGPKKEWLRRLEQREEAGKDSRLYKATEDKWDLWYERTAAEEITSRWALSNDQYLSDIFGNIYADFRAFKDHEAQQGTR